MTCLPLDNSFAPQDAVGPRAQAETATTTAVNESGHGSQTDTFSLLEASLSFLEPEPAEPTQAPQPLEVLSVPEPVPAKTDAPQARPRTEGRLAPNDRAGQFARTLARKYRLGTNGADLLTEIFCHYSYKSTPQAVEKLLNSGVEVDELDLVFHARVVWSETQEYWSLPSRSYYTALSWPICTSLVRMFHGLPSKEELEILLDALFAQWKQSPRREPEDYFFQRYVKHRSETATEAEVMGYRTFELDDIYPAEELLDWGHSPDYVDTHFFQIHGRFPDNALDYTPYYGNEPESFKPRYWGNEPELAITARGR